MARNLRRSRKRMSLIKEGKVSGDEGKIFRVEEEEPNPSIEAHELTFPPESVMREVFAEKKIKEEEGRDSVDVKPSVINIQENFPGDRKLSFSCDEPVIVDTSPEMLLVEAQTLLAGADVEVIKAEFINEDDDDFEPQTPSSVNFHESERPTSHQCDDQSHVKRMCLIKEEKVSGDEGVDEEKHFRVKKEKPNPSIDAHELTFPPESVMGEVLAQTHLAKAEVEVIKEEFINEDDDDSEPQTPSSVNLHESERPISHQFDDQSQISTLFVCHNCNLTFSCKLTLKRHILGTHRGKKCFGCSSCDKTFARKWTLKCHVLVHTGEKPFACHICDKTFFQNSYLKRHISNIHAGKKPFKCLLCDKTFAQSSSLRKHISLHTGEKPFACYVCGKTFKRKDSFNVHFLLHTGDKPFSCSFCYKAFSQNSNLKRHISGIHAGKKSFVCHICDKTFARSSTLNRHLLVHTGEKPFVCHVCKKTFTRKFRLNLHSLRHTAEKPFNCPFV